MPAPRATNLANLARANLARKGEGFWTVRRTEILIDLAGRGFTFSDIADAIGDGCTRNMIAGKADRLGVEISAKNWRPPRREFLPTLIEKARAWLAALEAERDQLGGVP